VALLATLFVLASSRPARAGDAAAAQDLFEQGLKLLEADDWKGACEKFRASMEAEPSGGTALNLARCHEREGESASAWAEYTRAVTLFRAARDADRAAFAEEQARRLEPTLSKLTIDVAPTPGLVIERDGVVVVEGAYGVPVAVDPGERTITAHAEGYEPWTTTVTVGTSPDVYAVTVPALEQIPDEVVAPADDGPSQGLVIAGGILSGVGGAAVVVGGILGGMVLSDASTLDANCTSPSAEASRGCEGEDEGLRQSANDKALVSTVLITGGGIIAAGGIVLLIIGLTSDDDGAGDEMVQLLPQIGPDHAGLTFTTRF